MSTALVHAENLGFGYDPAQPLFTGLRFDIPASGITLIQGGESRGKTTLLRLLAGQQHPINGTLRMSGLAMHEPALTAHIYAHDSRLPDWNDQTPRLYFGQMAQQFPRFDHAVVTAMLDHLQLVEHADKAMYMLSTGSKRKVSWVAALACGADLLLMDEPFAALDLSSIRKLHQLLDEWPVHNRSTWVLADYIAPGSVALSTVIDLGN
jgi:ABC-type nitrate/sulfonate/bicarbonate transport system ATPase subunit